MSQDEQLSKVGMAEKLEREITQADVGTSLKDLQVNNIPNPLAMNMYTLGFDSNKKLAPLTQTTKQNLKTYLSQYRLVTDAINIKDAYIINIAVNFAILTTLAAGDKKVMAPAIGPTIPRRSARSPLASKLLSSITIFFGSCVPSDSC